MRLPIAPEGTREILIALAVAGLWVLMSLGIGKALLGRTAGLILAAIGVMAFAAVLMFFRDPRRRAPSEPGLILSAADGRVTHVQRLESEPTIGGPAVRISAFLSVANVHVNRSPCGGRVVGAKIRAGGYLDARDEDSAERNFCNTLVLEADPPIRGPVVVRQIAGRIARRIVCGAAAGQRLVAGQKFGMIKFGSRTDVIVPAQPGLEVLARVGQRVYGGLTVLARVAPPTDPAPAAVAGVAVATP